MKIAVVRDTFSTTVKKTNGQIAPARIKFAICDYLQHLFFCMCIACTQRTAIAKRRRLTSKGYLKITKALDVLSLMRMRHKVNTLIKVQFSKEKRDLFKV
jgi:hypothetical protein